MHGSQRVEMSSFMLLTISRMMLATVPTSMAHNSHKLHAAIISPSSVNIKTTVRLFLCVDSRKHSQY